MAIPCYQDDDNCENKYNIDIFQWRNGKKVFIGKDQPRRKRQAKKAKKELWEVNQCLIED